MDVSTAVERLRYRAPQPGQEALDECEKTFWLKTTLDRGISGSLNFLIPPDGQAFTDVNATYISVSLQVFHADGSVLGSDDEVFLTPGTLQSLFRSVQVSLNGAAPLEPNNAYSWSSTLTSYLGMAKTARQDVWNALAGMQVPNFSSSKLMPTETQYFTYAIAKIANSRTVTLTGRLMSDFLQSCAQLIPPGVKLEVSLMRSADAFTICSCDEDPSKRYKVEISSASLFVRRVRLCQAVLERTLAGLAEGGELAYTRLGCVVNQVPATGVSVRFGNVFNGAPLPQTLYLILVNQKAYAGAQDYLGNYFESGYLRSLQVFENGRPVMPQPLRTKYVYEADGYKIDGTASNATEPFLSVTQALNGIADTRVVASLSYDEFIQGCIVSCVQLNSCGGTRVGPGFLDIEMELGEDIHREPMNLLCFGEYDKVVKLDKNLNILPH